MIEFRTFRDLAELIEWLKHFEFAYYHAPLDPKPVRVQIKQVTLNHDRPESSKATIWTPETRSLSLKLIDHFDRFRYPINHPDTRVIALLKQLLEELRDAEDIGARGNSAPAPDYNVRYSGAVTKSVVEALETAVGLEPINREVQ